MKTGEDGCAPKGSRKRVLVVGNAAPQLRSQLEVMVANSLEAKERAEKVAVDERDAPAVQEAFAFLMGYTMTAKAYCEDAEKALAKAKKRMDPADVKRVRQALRVAAAAAGEALESIRSRTD